MPVFNTSESGEGFDACGFGSLVGDPSNLRRLSAILLGAYVILTAYTLGGSLFGIRYQPFFTPLLTVFAFLFALTHGSVRLGWGRVLLFLGITFGVSLLFESVGVATGLVYGPYHYSARLGPKFLGLVPYLIPVAWFMMIYPSFLIAARLAPLQRSRWGWWVGIAALGATAMTAWDLAMDPMMVAGGHWTWETQGDYFGIPLQNFLGWWVTTFTTLILFLIVSRLQPEALFPAGASFDRLAVLSYAVTGMSSVLVDLLRDLNGPALVGLFAMAPWVLLSWLQTPRVQEEPNRRGLVDSPSVHQKAFDR